MIVDHLVVNGTRTCPSVLFCVMYRICTKGVVCKSLILNQCSNVAMYQDRRCGEMFGESGGYIRPKGGGNLAYSVSFLVGTNGTNGTL